MMKYKKIGIIAALECELRVLVDALENSVEETVGGTKMYTGHIGNYDVVLMLCGIGKVSAALGAQAMITRFAPEMVINIGCAGALSEKLRVGDIVLADKTVEWDIDLMPIGLPRGYISALDSVMVRVDQEINALLAEVIGPEAYHGTIASGDQFVSRPEQRKLILDSFPDALCAEMEGAAIGHVCAQNNIPFTIVRSISDTANGDSGVEFAAFAEIAGKKTASYMLEFLRRS